jgi:hypothetical protein
LRYEDLTKDPVAEMRRLYEKLDLGDFENVRAPLERYLAENERYERNKWQPTDAEIARIVQHWGPMMDRYGYSR